MCFVSSISIFLWGENIDVCEEDENTYGDDDDDDDDDDEESGDN